MKRLITAILIFACLAGVQAAYDTLMRSTARRPFDRQVQCDLTRPYIGRFHAKGNIIRLWYVVIFDDKEFDRVIRQRRELRAMTGKEKHHAAE